MLAGIAVAGTLLAASVTTVAVAADAVAAPPPQRAYELVSPVDKGASDANAGVGASADGEAVTYTSFGTLPGAPTADFGTFYRAQRTSSGWTTNVLSPLQTLPDRTSLATSISPQDFTPDYDTMFTGTFDHTVPLVAEDTNASVDVYTSTSGGATRWLTAGLDPTAHGDTVYAGRSADGRTVVFESNRQFVPDVPGDPGDDPDPSTGLPRIRQVYALVDGTPHIVSLVDDGSGHDVPAPGGAQFGAGRTTPYSSAPPDRSALSADGRRVFFTAGGQLYVRIDGTRTVLVSASQVVGAVGDPAPSADARFAGASDDGHYVTFTSSDPLVDGATIGGLYGLDVDGGTLRLLAETNMGLPSATVRTAPDGSRVYFVASRELAGEGTDFAENLWVAHADGSRHFIGTLDGGDSAIANGNGENPNLAAITADGTRLAFQSAAKLGRYDNAGTTEVYVYDDSTERTTCVSCPPGGADPVGPAALRDPGNNIGSLPRNITDDGDVFFESPEQLSDADTDDRTDVYEYTGGRAVLISTGTSTDTHYVDNSTDGSSVFIRTRDALVPADTDGGYADVYVARVGGGFPVTTPPAACEGSACRPAPTPDPGPPAAPPTVFALDAAPGAVTRARTTFSVGAVSAARRSAFARTGRLALKVRVSDAAVVTASGRAQIGRRRVTVATGSINKLAAGSTTLTVRLTSAARRALARSGRLTLRLTVACSDTTRTAHATLVLHHAKTKTTKKGR
ncbi:TolB family protein [Conexibacter woesei]|uniref:TolB family protein n=1 Tax=Conexibacter woesei TaxID=191495 RepID=UPI000410ED84|nr:hypothetical protein [Conexibacter woesei]